MQEELDEFGIPIRKKPSQEVDEFGIPIKKKISLEPAKTQSPISSMQSGIGLTPQPSQPFDILNNPPQEQAATLAPIQQGTTPLSANQQVEKSGLSEIDRLTTINEQIRNNQFKDFLAKKNTPEATKMLQGLINNENEWAKKSPEMRMETRYQVAGGKEKYEQNQAILVKKTLEQKARLEEESKQDAKYSKHFDSDFARSTARYIRGGFSQLLGSVGKTLTETTSGALNILRDGSGLINGKSDKLYNSDGSKSDYANNLGLSDDPGQAIDRLILSLDGLTTMSNAMLSEETLPNSVGGRFTTAMARIIPDVAAMVFAPEAKAAQLSTKLNAAKNLVWNPFTKYMIAKGGLSAYAQEKQMGANMEEATIGGLKGAGEGGIAGATVGILGGIAGKFSKEVTGDLIKSGVIGLDSHITKAGIRAISESLTFGGAPIVEAYAKSVATGQDMDRKAVLDEAITQAGIGAAFGVKSGIKEFNTSKKEYATYRELIDEVLPKMQENAFGNFLRADIQTIGKVATSVNEAGDLHAKGIELIAKSAREPSEAKRNEMLANAALNMKLADIKSIADVVVNQKQEVIDFIDKSEISQEAKDFAFQKINDIAKLLSENGQKRAAIEEKVELAAEKTNKLADELLDAKSKQDVDSIKQQAEEVGKVGIEESQKLTKLSEKENFVETKPTGTEGIKYEVGDEIILPDVKGTVFVKELLENDEAVVAIVEDGQYREQTITLKPVENVQQEQVQENISPAGDIGSEDTTLQTAEMQSQDGQGTLPTENNDSGTTEPIVVKPRKPSRTTKQLGREPASFEDAVNQFFLSGNKLSTEDFIRHTGFGYFKVEGGKKIKLTQEETDEFFNNGSLKSGQEVKMSDELRKAKFAGKVADKAKGGIAADQILQFYVPEQFAGEQGMDLVTDIVNTAANKTRGQILRELESTNTEPTALEDVENFGYSAEEIAEMEALDRAVENESQEALTEQEIEALESENRGELLRDINDELANEIITPDQSEAIITLADKYTDENGVVDWDSLEQDYFDTFISNTDVNFDVLPQQETLKRIFENGNTKIKRQVERSKQSKVNSLNTSREVNSPNERGGSETNIGRQEGQVAGDTAGTTPAVDETVSSADTSLDAEVQPGTEQNSGADENNTLQPAVDARASEGKAKVAEAQSKVDVKQSEVSNLQNEVNRLSEKLAKNLRDNQADLFGNNKTQSLFDDKADQQKLFDDKVSELREAQKELVKAKQALADIKETEGQVELAMPESNVEIDGETTDLAKNNEDDDAKIIVQSIFNPLKLISGVQKLVDKVENRFTEKFVPKVTDFVAEKLKAWRQSKWTAKQYASSYASSIFGGIARNSKDIDVKLGLIGGKNMAVYNMGKVMKGLYAMVDGNTESLERIHVVLDPDFYQQGLGGQSSIFSQNSPPTQEVSNVYNADQDYIKIGSVQDYQDYVSSIFPDSQVKGVVYHGTMSSKVPKDNYKGYVTYFTNDKNYAETFGFPIDRKIVNNVVDVRNPYYAKSELADVPEEVHNSGKYTDPKAIKASNKGYDSVIGKDAGQKDGETIVIFEPSQIHILGTEKDKQGFSDFKKNQVKSNNTNVPPPNLTYNDLTVEEQGLFDEIRKQLDDIHFKNYALGFISQDVFDKHKGTYVPRMYETFELPTEIQEELDKYQDQVGDKLNLNPFKKRKGLDALSDESKNAILKDPVYIMAKRLMQLDTNSAIMTYINHINRNNKSLIYEGANPPLNYQKLEGKAYGALDGKYVPSYVAEDLRGYFFVTKWMNNAYDVIKDYDRTWARQAVKKGLTVFNPFVQIGNFTSNVVFAQLGGIDFVRWFGNTPKAMKELLNKGQDYEDLLAAGLVGSDVLAKDLRPNTTNAISLAQKEQADRDASTFRKIKKPFAWLNDKAMDVYSGNDDYAKINAYQIFKEQGYSKEEAIKKVYDAFQNYATVGKFWDVVAKSPIFGNPFMKFSADLMRITGNAVAKKPLSTSLYIAGLMMLPQLLQQLGISDEEDELKKELRESRPFIPKMDLGVVNVPLVYKTKYGELNLARYITPYYFFDNGEDGSMSSMLSRFNPYKSVKSQSYGKGNEREMPFGQDPVLGTLYNIMMDTDFRGKSIQDPEATRFRASGITDEQKWTNRATNALRTWVPNGALAHDTYLNAKYGEDFYGRTRTTAQALVNFAIKIQDFKEGDYKKTAEKQVYSFVNDLKSQAETIKNTYVTDARKRAKKQKDLQDGKISAADYQNSIEKFDEELKERVELGQKELKEIQKKLNDFAVKYDRILKE